MRVDYRLVGMGASFPLLSLLWFLSSPRLQLGQCSAQCLFTLFLSTRKGMAPNLSDAAPASEGFCKISSCLLGLATMKLHFGFFEAGYAALPGPRVLHAGFPILPIPLSYLELVHSRVVHSCYL